MILINNKPPSHYWTTGKIFKANPFGNGHINDTYLIEAEYGKFILQRVNKAIFNTEALIHNFETHMPLMQRYQNVTGQKLSPAILKTRNKKFHAVDNEQFAWRLIEFVPDAKSFSISPHPDISYKAATAFARYQKFLNTIKTSGLKDTISGFHDLEARLKAFRRVTKTADCQLLLQAKQEIKVAQHFEHIAENSAKYIRQTPARITHNDTKLNNVLFSGNDVFVIDLDTVMPGKLMFDFGDMVRSYSSPVEEDHPDIQKTELRTDHFMAIARGYLGVLGNEIDETEKLSMLPGAKYIIYEQSLRFLTDFLQGSTYYKTSYPEHNLVRAKTQFMLLKSLCDNESVLSKEIKHL